MSEVTTSPATTTSTSNAPSTATSVSNRERVRRTAARGRRPLFYVVTAAFLAFLVFALNEPMRFAYLAWTPGYEAFTHRVHHVMIGALLTIIVLSVAVQLYRPAERVGAFLFGALAVGVLTVITLIADGVAAAGELAIFVVPLVIIGLLHPGLRALELSRDRLDTRVLALGIVAAVPLVAFAAVQLNLHLTLTNDHVTFGHYVMMAGGAVTIGLGALVVSLRPMGWRGLAYGVAALATLVGIASIVFPDPAQGVNFGVAGGALAVLWAVCFVAVAEYGARRTGGTDLEATDTAA